MTETSEPSIYEKAFAKSDKTDAILVVDGKKLHVNKALLSYHSDYFNTLFNSDFKEKSMEEIPIEDVKFEDFATLLSVIHDKAFEISKNNAENLLKLADRFLLNTPKRFISSLVKTSAEFSRYEKLMLADKYKLDDLLEYALDFDKKMTETPELSIYEKAFVKSDKTDAILVVDGKKLHVNKALLSYHSDYFKTLFNSNFVEKSMEEIPIEDVKLEDFATLLSLIQEEPLEITKENFDNLLKLADRFLLNAAKSAVENFIKISHKLTRHEKLILADKYKSEKLSTYALGLYDTKRSFYDFWYEKDRKFSDELKGKLFDSFFDRYADSLH